MDFLNFFLDHTLNLFVRWEKVYFSHQNPQLNQQERQANLQLEEEQASKRQVEHVFTLSLHPMFCTKPLHIH